LVEHLTVNQVVAGSSPAESANLNKGTKMTLDLTLEEINYILQAVGKAPFQECAPLINKIHVQAQPQLAEEEAKRAQEAEVVDVVAE
jgi:hypothetical protein